jgi:UDP-N-acetyl-D-glucosamine dehydrogenase
MRDSKDIETVEPSPGLTGLSQKIADRTAKVGVIGMGYVGVPTMVAVAEAGFPVTGIDTNQDRVREINTGQSYIEDVSDSALGSLVSQGLISASTDYGVVRDLDVILVCVPTPITKFKEPDLAAMEGAVAGLAANMGQQQLIVFQSTTFPGNTEEFALPELEGNGLKVGRDFYLAFALERIDPGNRQFLVRDLPKVVGGITGTCTEVASAFFSSFVDQIIPVSSPKVAEMTKLLENTFRSVNIALVNELSILCHRMDIDIWEVVDAASTKPFGFMPFYPGPGVGGHCIPVDPFYLSWKAKEYDFYVNFIQLAAETNDHMPYYTLSRIGEILNDHELPLKGSKLLVLGVTFKADVNDTRNSPALKVLELLVENGAEVSYSDRYAPKISVKGQEMNSLELDAKVIQGFDASVIMVNHGGLNLDLLIKHSKLVIDGQNATKGMAASSNIIAI